MTFMQNKPRSNSLTWHSQKNKELVENKLNNNVWAAAIPSDDQGSIVPIEDFKTKPQDIFPVDLPHFFRSSGTSQKERSVSQFSDDGLASYQLESLTTFYSMLSDYFKNPETILGYSLVPTVQEWPDSSLARMIQWISEVSTISYSLHCLKSSDTPVWIFGTGFHFVALFDDGVKFRLPPGSIVIETGGTKGKTRDVSRSELHQMIRQTFGIDQTQIVSEYGMCELSCQAYEWTRFSGRFRFPSWVNLYIQQDSSSLARKGFGALVVQDPLRIDCPHPIRTQDYVQLDGDGSFQLLGRLPNTILKGCSLNAEELLGHITTAEPSLNVQVMAHGIINPMDFVIEYMEKNLRLWLQSPEVKESLVPYLDHEDLITQAIEDILRDIPNSFEDWRTSLQLSINDTSPQRWLIVSPQTHPIAILYPVIFGACIGLKMTLRPAKRDSKFYDLLVSFLKPICSLALADSYWKVNSDNSDLFDRVLVFGSDETIADIQKSLPIPVVGFGTAICVNFVSACKLIGFLPDILNDLKSLAGLGCLSSRGIFVTGNDTPEIRLNIATNLDALDLPELSLPTRIRLFQKLTEFQSKNFIRLANGMLIHFKKWQEVSSVDSLLEVIPWIIPIIFVDKTKNEDVLASLQSNPQIAKIGYQENAIEQKLHRHGTLNSSPWSGKLHKKSLFIDQDI